MLFALLRDPTGLKLLCLHLEMVATLSYLWIPLVFLAYMIGRRQFRLNLILLFVAVEASAVWYAMYSHAN